MATLSKNGKRLGRPAKPYDPRVGDRICQLLATTTIGLEDALEQAVAEVNKQLPADGKVSLGLTTIYWWLEDNPPFAEQYARARERQAGILHDRAQKEAETERTAILKRKGKRGGKDFEEVGVSDNVQRSRLIVDTMLKRAGQLNPKKYGDPGKNSGDNDAPVKIQVEIVGVPQAGRKLKPPPEFVLTPEVRQLPSGD